MKVFSTILSFYILLLTAVPVMPMLSQNDKGQCKMKCCMMKENTKDCKPHKKQSGDCKGGACNPFMICCNCYALTSGSQNFSAPFKYTSQHFSLTAEKINVDFLSDAWHPPKNV